MAKLDLSAAYQKAFGYIGTPFIGLRTATQVTAAASKSGIETVDDSEADNSGVFTRNTSVMGHPYFMPCKLDDFQLPNEPLIEINGTKDIVKTPIDGNDGKFKQLYSLGDYVIIIRGIAVNENNDDEYPEEQVRALRSLYEKRESVQVVCKLLGIFAVKYLTIEDGRFPVIEGSPGMQPYEFICSSDKFFDLELLEGTN